MTNTKKRRVLLQQLLAEVRAAYGPNYEIKIVKRRKSGRPKKLYVARDEGLVLALDWMREAYREKGLNEREARKRAFAEAKEVLKTEDADGHLLAEGRRRNISGETIERYYRAGIEKLRESEMRLALEIDKHGLEGVPEYLDWPEGILRRRYRRGKRALAAAKRKQDK